VQAVLEDVMNDFASHLRRNLMAQIVQRPLYSSVAPIPVLGCHADDQPFYLIPGSRPTRATMFAAIVFLGDESSLPSQEGLRRNDRGDFAEQAPPEHFRLGRQASALTVVQAEAFGSQLLAHLVFFAEIIDGVALLLAQPSRNRNQQ
jgi:hypothetical protein